MSVESTPNSIQILLRISDANGNESAIENKAIRLAQEVESIFVVDGSNITPNVGRWKGSIEFGATIEVVVKNYGVLIEGWMQYIRNFAVEELGLTVFVTVHEVKVIELY